MSRNWKKYLGPGPLVAAAFIGPGTVTVCTLAGVGFGYEMLWALALSMLATIVLQEMAARISLFHQKGLMEVVIENLQNKWVKVFSIGLILMAIVLGNAAYEAGNISGGALGIATLFPMQPLLLGPLKIEFLNILIGLLALILLMSGSYTAITRYLTALVVLMSLAFLITAGMVKPDFWLLMKGFVPSIRSESIITVVALVGTTVVPYNLFLHASLVAKKWQSKTDLHYVRVDTVAAVMLGGLVSMAIVVVAAAGKAIEVTNAADLAKGLEPLLGPMATYFMAFGLFAAGITSAITAPLAGSLVIVGCFGWSTRLSSLPMRISMCSIWGLGMVFASFGIKPVQLITSAQLANGMLLPLLSAYILWLINRKAVLGSYTNTWYWNIISFGIWLITLLLGIRSIMRVIETW
jgi:manganese transport protein